ncbi:MAG: endonuclease MutS2, partial [Lachnospiraceae bacterium]|nr:endonuclease MutS2 [Lachnospiraceae bacterium]
NKKGLKILEYPKIISMLSDRANSAPGKAMCEALTPSADIGQINQAQTQTADALARLFAHGRTSFGSNRDIGYAVNSLAIRSARAVPELLGIAGLLENTERVRRYGRQVKDGAPDDSLTELFEGLSPLPQISGEIRRCILSEDEIADDASSNLKRIRRQMRVTTDRIHTQLNSMVTGSMRTMLQDAVITMRDNRYCLPVRAEYKGQVSGMVHDQSSTGSTYFIEPAAVVSLNNEIRELEIEEQEELHQILADLSALAGAHTKELLRNQKLMTKLDFIFAKAQLAMDMNATRPLFNADHEIRIRGGRHPLLDPKTVVPIDISLGRDFDLLIVTGPNTGGKTVSLKTVGLFTLMGQAGLHIPALDRSELGLFTRVYADIGDEQSIEQSLSTFSAHMTNIVSILKYADQDSLCLFDELGAGTDPTEGAALAIAILNYLHDRGIRTMATTHYSELKLYALSTPFVENACCEFDVASLRPTYRLLIGIPGKSNAFAISRRLGLSQSIIDAAKEQISSDKESFEDVIASLEQSRKTLERDQKEIAANKAEIKRLKKELEEKQEKLDASKNKILREANEQARAILQDAKDTADETIRQMNKSHSSTVGDLEKQRAKLREKIDKQNAKLSVKAQKQAQVGKPLTSKDIQLGTSIRVVSSGLTGTIYSLPDKKGNLFIQCGILQTQVNISDLVLAEEAPAPAAVPVKKSGTGTGGLSKALTISPEINLLGCTVDEALSKLDKYLDDAYLSHLQSVRIVHGKGTGALRNAVHQHLKRTSYIKSYRLGEAGEGDYGVTIAVFK